MNRTVFLKFQFDRWKRTNLPENICLNTPLVCSPTNVLFLFLKHRVPSKLIQHEKSIERYPPTT